MNASGCEPKSWEYLYLTCLFPISEYAKRVEPRVTKRYLEKISAIRIHPMLIAGKFFEPETSILKLSEA